MSEFLFAFPNHHTPSPMYPSINFPTSPKGPRRASTHPVPPTISTLSPLPGGAGGSGALGSPPSTAHPSGAGALPYGDGDGRGNGIGNGIGSGNAEAGPSTPRRAAAAAAAAAARGRGRARRLSITVRSPVRSRSKATSGGGGHGDDDLIHGTSYHEEIIRLELACKEHDRAIKAKQSTIEHRIGELRDMIQRFEDIDGEAEAITNELESATSSAQPLIAQATDDLYAENQAKVDAYKWRAEPWEDKALLGEHDDHDHDDKEVAGVTDPKQATNRGTERDPDSILLAKLSGKLSEMSGLERLGIWKKQVLQWLDDEVYILVKRREDEKVRGRTVWNISLFGIILAVIFAIVLALVR